MHNQPILVVEDDDEIAAILIAYLEKQGYRTERASNGAIALTRYDAVQPQLVILDIRMPLKDGWQVLAELRRLGDTPVIMLTANDDDIDKLSALRIGADDYVVKPFNPAEVVARVQAILRRVNLVQSDTASGVIHSDWIDIHLANHSVIVRPGNRDIAMKLTTTEFRLLAHLARTPDRVCSRNELLETCMPEGETLPRTVDSHLSKLRKKLEEEGVCGLLQNVRGFGYRLGRKP
ncbi:DNA-binding response regulator [Erwinia sp. OLTSP20]|uniref:response regulator n=1 Tax=unclassified Erwinia TaxID=2622719 RepID=UPI000C1A3541|nr:MULTISPECIES: response regulator [unclassified Erwinia]PIJ50950.1 DNA-binding response regulator [Erwinia sp. OAMSP11]PIJ75922.1 DNA-binding response regulator [Erwinia sp. OLSSP12]PIJ83632.1 DNA-binding response regulator [Erwinia sp. OLCASP19]PIJ87488.1 DNA-binding response regulator [Erwinia sp. OLMTSP26]PIJ89036.1 DNA-binding response regulator [Erwinia sp. OLMDSP33]